MSPLWEEVSHLWHSSTIEQQSWSQCFCSSIRSENVASQQSCSLHMYLTRPAHSEKCRWRPSYVNCAGHKSHWYFESARAFLMIMFSFAYGVYCSLQFGQFLLFTSHSSMQFLQNNRSQLEHCWGSSTTFVQTRQFKYSLREFSKTAWLYWISVEKLICSIFASG